MKVFKRIMALFIAIALASVSFFGCEKSPDDDPTDTTKTPETSAPETDSNGNRIPSENEEKVLETIDLFLYDTDSPLYHLKSILADGASGGYTADMTVTDNAIDYKDTVTRYTVTATDYETIKIAVSSKYEDCDPLELELYTWADGIAISNKELYNDKLYGFTYDDLYNNFSKTPFSPTEDYSTSVNLSKLKSDVHKTVAEIGRYDIVSQYNVLRDVRDAFYYSAVEEKATGSLKVNDTGVVGDIYSFTLTGQAYESFYSSLKDILSDNTTVRNYIINTATDFLGFGASLSDLDAEGYRDFIDSLEEKGKSGAENGAEISFKACIKNDELLGICYTNKTEDEAKVYSFAKMPDGNIAYNVYTFVKYDPHFDQPKNMETEESGVITLTNSEKEHNVDFTYKMSYTQKGLTEPYVVDDEGLFYWNKETGAYKLEYLDLLGKHVREGKLTFSDDAVSGFEFESYCRIPKVESITDENYLEYAADTLLNRFGDMKLSFMVSKNAVEVPEYTDILKMSSAEAKEFRDGTVANFTKAMNKESFANFFTTANIDFLRNRCPEDINDLKNVSERLKLSAFFMYTEVYEIFDLYYYADEGEVAEKVFNDMGMIENGKYYWPAGNIDYLMPYDDAVKDPYYDEISYYIVTFENYKATVTYFE